MDRQIAKRFNAQIDLGASDLTLKQSTREVGVTASLERYDIRPVAVHVLGRDPDDFTHLRDTERDSRFTPAVINVVLNSERA